MDLIISHAKCCDGWAAAFIAKKKYPEAEILMLDHGTPPPFEQVSGREVVVFDFSWPNRLDNIQLHDSAKSFHIYDHHRTAAEVLTGLDFVTFDQTRSGAGLAWDYLFGKDSDKAFMATESATWTTGKWYTPRPWYVDFVEDRDLWNWKLPNSKEINAYIVTLPQTVEDWSTLDDLDAEAVETFGGVVVCYIDKYVQEAVQQAQFGIYYFPEYPQANSVAICNVPSMNCSEIGNALAEKADFSLTWFETSQGLIQFSLRSIGDFDVSEIAKKYQGGGHRNAAGFRMPRQEGRILLDSITGHESD